ncbi:hypothetical protein FNV64_07010 [Streptomyces sp. S1A1-7]|nr:hypothetical protein FNV64_07010 [Streptomyces sp. S1A1-7]
MPSPSVRGPVAGTGIEADCSQDRSIGADCRVARRPGGEGRPRDTVRSFLDSAYHAGARLAGWDTTRGICPGGITDPVTTPVSRPAAGAFREGGSPP